MPSALYMTAQYIISSCFIRRLAVAFVFLSADSLDVMERIHSHHESAYTNHVVLGVAHFLCTVINTVEFTNLITVTDFSEQVFNCFSAARHLEIIFADATFCESCWVQKVNSLRFITVVLIVGHRFALFIRDVSSNSWSTESTGCIFVFSYGI